MYTAIVSKLYVPLTGLVFASGPAGTALKAVMGSETTTAAAPTDLDVRGWAVGQEAQHRGSMAPQRSLGHRLDAELRGVVLELLESVLVAESQVAGLAEACGGGSGPTGEEAGGQVMAVGVTEEDVEGALPPSKKQRKKLKRDAAIAAAAAAAPSEAGAGAVEEGAVVVAAVVAAVAPEAAAAAKAPATYHSLLFQVTAEAPPPILYRLKKNQMGGRGQCWRAAYRLGIVW